MSRLFAKIGASVLHFCCTAGDIFRFLCRTCKTFFLQRCSTRAVLTHMVHIGVESSIIIILTGFFTGLALAFQTYVGFSKFGIEHFIGPIVALGMVRELGPVLTGLMVTARAGSAMAAEIGTMKITEQIDALKTLNINPYRYLVVPRVIASIIVMPCLTIFSALCGIAGGYLFYTYVLELNPESYTSGIRQLLELSDVSVGLIKSSFFGLILSWVGSYYGYRTSDGARGVGRATTKSVVTGSILILVMNYFLSSFLFQTGLG